MERGGYIYILTNKNKTTLYTGITSDLVHRIQQHKDKASSKSFSSRYNTTLLVYFEVFSTIEEAIFREKQIKGGSRKAKEKLINKLNPQWDDLTERIDELNDLFNK